MTIQYDIIISTLGPSRYLDDCLESIRRHSHDHRVTWVDHGPEAAIDYDANIAYIHCPEASGLNAAYNVGIKATSAPFVVLMHDDSEATEDWLDGMERGFGIVDHVGMVSPLLSHDPYGRQEKPQWKGKGPLIAEPLLEMWPDAKGLGHLPVTFCGNMIRRDVFTEIGLLDEECIDTGWGGDDDFQARLWLAGWRSVVQSDVTIVHHGQGSQKSGVRSHEENARCHERNAQHLRAKWAKLWPQVEERKRRLMKLNVGSGQRRFDTKEGWINVDRIVRPDQVPDVTADGEALPFTDQSTGCVVLHHVLEHFGCGEGGQLLRECHRVLRPGGKLLVFVPDMRALASRWLTGLIDDFTFLVNVYGAYQGEESDRHRWLFTKETLVTTLRDGVEWANVRLFDWRPIAGADIARDWWIIGMECVK